MMKHAVLLFLILSLPFSLFAVTVFEDDFERDNLAPWTTTDTSRSGIGTYTANSGTRSLYTRNQAVTVTTPVIPLGGTANGVVKMWIRRGSDAFSEDPDRNEDFIIEYLSNTGTWIQIAKYLGSGTNGQIINLSYDLPDNAYWDSFQLRVRQTSGSGPRWDYWHLDDVEVSVDSPPQLSISKRSCVISDPVNNTANPKRIPGAVIRYAIEVNNTGAGDADDVNVTDDLDTVHFDTSTIDNIQIKDGACDCKGTASAGVANTANPVVLEFDTVAAPTGGAAVVQKCGYFEVEIK